MGHYRKQEVDFIVRTKIIIEQYGNHIPKSETKYNVTLFINCLVGLLIIPQQYWYNNLPTADINEQEWGITLDMILYSNNGKSVRSVATHLRNSISHYKFTSLPNDKDILDIFNFTDINPRDGSETFNANIPFLALKKFAFRLTDIFISSMNAEK